MGRQLIEDGLRRKAHHVGRPAWCERKGSGVLKDGHGVNERGRGCPKMMEIRNGFGVWVLRCKRSQDLASSAHTLLGKVLK